jgi:hypothetical protein
MHRCASIAALVWLAGASADAGGKPGLAGAHKTAQPDLDAAAYRSSSQGPKMAWEEQAKDRLADELEIDAVIDRASATHGWSPVIPKYTGAVTWAWRQWSGTIIERLWQQVAYNMLVPALIVLGVHALDPSTSLWWQIPGEPHFLVTPLLAVNHGWNYLLTLTTFVTTFFVGHAHSFWRNCYRLSRTVQGRFNDVGLLVATHAARDAQTGGIEPAAHDCVLDIARYLRLSHVFFWADVCYRRTVDHGASVRVLLSDTALDRLMERGMLTPREHEVLTRGGIPPSRWYCVMLEWVIARFIHARRDGLFLGGEGLEQTFLARVCELRSAFMSVPDELAARMPLAYVHFTHCLVDLLLFLAPYALYPKVRRARPDAAPAPTPRPPRRRAAARLRDPNRRARRRRASAPRRPSSASSPSS